MTLKRYAAKRDVNERALIDALRACGFQVVALSDPGVPDLLVNKAGRSVFVEVKSGTGTLTPHQRTLLAAWEGAPVIIASEVQPVLDWWGTGADAAPGVCLDLRPKRARRRAARAT